MSLSAPAQAHAVLRKRKPDGHGAPCPRPPVVTKGTLAQARRRQDVTAEWQSFKGGSRGREASVSLGPNAEAVSRELRTSLRHVTVTETLTACGQGSTRAADPGHRGSQTCSGERHPHSEHACGCPGAGLNRPDGPGVWHLLGAPPCLRRTWAGGPTSREVPEGVHVRVGPLRTQSGSKGETADTCPVGERAGRSEALPTRARKPPASPDALRGQAHDPVSPRGCYAQCSRQPQTPSDGARQGPQRRKGSAGVTCASARKRRVPCLAWGAGGRRADGSNGKALDRVRGPRGKQPPETAD